MATEMPSHLLLDPAQKVETLEESSHPASSPPEWIMSKTPPADLARWIESAEGGFFHSPLGLSVGAPAGEPLYATLQAGAERVGIAVGVLSSCRFGSTPRHAYFPTLPALAPAYRRDRILEALIAKLYHRGMAEVSFHSFDANWIPEKFPPNGNPRLEHLVPLEGGPDQILNRLGSGHRRNCRRGIRAGWKLRQQHGEAARTTMSLVLESAAQRADELGRGFAPGIFAGLSDNGTGPELPAAEMHVHSVLEDDVLLAAGLVGVAGDHGYYIMGGSTPEGYRSYAAVWLHFSIMTWLATRGCKVYNLGGTPAAAEDPADPGHGLFRFKTQLGGETRLCRGFRLILRPAHMSLHQALGFAGRLLRR